jgi:hypothetical protein
MKHYLITRLLPVGKSERKPRRKMECKYILRERVDRIQLAQDGVQWRAVMNTLMNLRVA